MNDLVNFTVRLKKKVHAWLKGYAKSQSRSINKQIEHELEKIEEKEK